MVIAAAAVDAIQALARMRPHLPSDRSRSRMRYAPAWWSDSTDPTDRVDAEERSPAVPAWARAPPSEWSAPTGPEAAGRKASLRAQSRIDPPPSRLVLSPARGGGSSRSSRPAAQTNGEEIECLHRFDGPGGSCCSQLGWWRWRLSASNW